MKYDELNLQKLRELSILEVAEKLGFKLKGLGDEGRRAICPYHADKHPSLHFSKKKGIFKCFVCGAKGDLFKLVMDERNCSFIEACDWLVNEFHVVLINDKPSAPSCSPSLSSRLSPAHGEISKDFSTTLEMTFSPLPSSLVTRSLSLDSQFCKSAISAGYLTESQLRHAAERYRLGRSKEGGVIFWQIDNQQRVHTGKIMYYQPDCHRDKQHHPTWVHALMKSQLPQDYTPQHCLFGLHLLGSHPDPLMGRGYLNVRATGGAVKPPNIGGGLAGVDASFSSFLRAEEKDRSGNKGVAIVESEKTAIILSVKFPDFIWLSCGGLQMFKPELLEPLLQYRIVIFPDTDETGEAFKYWTQVAQEAQRLYKFRYPLRISPLLEQKATPEQKQKKIDLVDFLYPINNESNV